jgi:hypothetical protein
MQARDGDKSSGANRGNILHKFYRMPGGKWPQTRLKLKIEVF